MTIFSPLTTSGAIDSIGGHLDRRHQPFTHPMENAMSPDQFDQLKRYLEQMAEGFATKAEYDVVVAELNQQVVELQKDKDAAHVAIGNWSTQAETARAELAEAQGKLIDAEKVFEDMKGQIDKKDDQITDLEAQLKEAQAQAAEAQKALEDEKASHHKADTAKKKDKGGAAH